jgi:hypothetical protein
MVLTIKVDDCNVMKSFILPLFYSENASEKRASLQISDHLSLFWGCLSRDTLQCICTETHHKCFEICSIVQDPQDVSRIGHNLFDRTAHHDEVA